MKKIIPFKKEIMFKNTIEEIVSISMDNHLEIDDITVKGNFIISGEYEYSQKKEPFSFDIPYLGYIDEIYDTKDSKIDIDDFYYEISEPNKLSIFIDISIDNLLEKPLVELEPDTEEERREIMSEFEEEKENEREREIIPEIGEVFEEEKIEDPGKIIFNNPNLEESYMTYKVYIVREGDTIDSILTKYEIARDQLFKYNVINELNIGDKLIIPHEKN